MNIFVLDEDPRKAARMLCDKHLIKMILESAQMLCSAYESGEAPYRRTHYNHPSTKWSRASYENYKWLFEHADEMCSEYQKYFGKVHKSSKVIWWCWDNRGKLSLPKKGLTPFSLAMPKEYMNKNATTSYRNYYLHAKSGIATWTRGREAPDWFLEGIKYGQNGQI